MPTRWPILFLSDLYAGALLLVALVLIFAMKES